MVTGGVKTVGIDLGSANTLIYVQNKGIVLREPSVVSIDTNDGSLVAVGKEAKAMIGKNPKNIQVIRPLRDGVIADFDITRIMIKHFLRSVLNNFSIRSPWVIISIPYGITDIERRAVMEAAQQSGAKKTLLIEEPLAAAIGAGLSVEEPSGHMIVNIGAGTSEIAVISLGGIVTAASLKAAGDALDMAIYNHLKKTYRVEIGLITAENFKIQFGDAYNASEETAHIRGIDLKTGLPIAKEVSLREINSVIQDTLRDLILAIRKVFENTPPQLASDIIEKGIVLTGGGANLKNLDKYISSKVKLAVVIPPEPEDCVALGTGKITKNTKILTRISLMGYQNFP
ncbi:rod shape-determining protein [Desulfitibacter alkalitolerans]|uniref:rod shape-determining protein n=1 Tax=Desulfitibacter alkalitolerans TaxID=264641 RepID=UPI00054F661F|nr:rod shape-determining protein [Desulfitibacter alkalitolerans]